MSKTGRTNHRRGTRGTAKAERHISVQSDLRDPPDLRKLSRAVIALAMSEAAIGNAQAASQKTDAAAAKSNHQNADAEEGRL